jgi:2-polyprenyl-3-methyl-5-hydroxy-6-metoxy-1,4-benzoquinol methylase
MSMTNNTATDFHSDIAEDFDNKYNDSPDFIERFDVWSKFLTQYIQPNQSVLDAGCGSGIFSFFLAARGVNVLGIDGAEGMVNLCTKKQVEKGVKNIEFRHGQLPFDSSQLGKYDAIISSSVLEYVPALEETIQSFYEMLPINGHLIISLPNNQSYYRKLESMFFNITGKPIYLNHVHNKFSVQQFNGKMKSVGFEFLESHYYAANYLGANILKGMLGDKNTANLFLAVYKKA